MSDREEGWYWVLISEGSRWECSQYEDGLFNLMQWGSMYENELFEIGDMVSRETKKAVKEEHVHEWVYIISFGINYCSCGDVMVKDGVLSKDQIASMQEQIKKPGNAFQVGAVKDEG